MKFSIVTPNFNGEKFLEEALRSVLAQRAEGLDVEYIVVDGGSTDGSMEIVERYRSEISTVIAEKDDGPADAISKGLSRATGDVLAWLNSDGQRGPRRDHNDKTGDESGSARRKRFSVRR